LFTNFSFVIEFITLINKKYNLINSEVVGVKNSPENLIYKGLKFFNIKKMEKIIFPIILFFSQFKKTFVLPIILLYIDTFSSKKKFYPRSLVAILKKFLFQAISTKNACNYEQTTNEDDGLITLLFYKFMSEIFLIVFGFSPAQVTFLSSKDWKNFVFYNYGYQVSKLANWEMLGLYSKNEIIRRNIKNQKKKFITHKNKNKKLFFDFYLFFKTKIKKLPKNNIVQEADSYITRRYFPLEFF
jgi:hypothetical protein